MSGFSACLTLTGKRFRRSRIFKEFPEPSWRDCSEDRHLRIDGKPLRSLADTKFKLTVAVTNLNGAQRLTVGINGDGHDETIRHTRLSDGALDYEFASR